MLLNQDEVNKTIKELRGTMKGLGTNEKVYITTFLLYHNYFPRINNLNCHKKF